MTGSVAVSEPPPPPPGPARVRLPLHLRTLRVCNRILPQVALGGLLLVGAALLEADDVVTQRVRVAVAYLLGWALLRALCHEVLSPVRPALRLVPLSDAAAVRTLGAVKVLLGVMVVTLLAQHLVRATGWNPAVDATLGIVRDVTLILFGAAALWGSGAPAALTARLRGGTRGVAVSTLVHAVLPLAVLTAIVLVVTTALGYERLASWIRGNAILTALQVLAATLSIHLLSRGWRNLLGLSRSDLLGPGAEPAPAAIGLERLGVGAIRLVVVVLAVAWISTTWDVSPREWPAVLDRGIFTPGGLTWARLLGGLLWMGVVVVLGRTAKTILTFLVFPRAEVEVGLRFAVLAVLRYLTIACAALLGLSAVGLDTSSLAWFLGAAGIGIGLGLQDVIANFFSGLIMLLERPVRVGDLIRVGNEVGTVEDIRIRGTVLRTSQNTTVLVPNRQMLAERLTNLSHGMDHGLVEVRVRVAPDADPAAVARLLREVARRHRDVRADPEPRVVFLDMGGAGLDFAVVVHTDRIRQLGAVGSELRFAIHTRLREAGVALAAPLAPPPTA